MEKSILENVAARLGRKPLQPNEYARRFESLKSAAEPPVFPSMPAGNIDFFRQQAEKNQFEISSVTDLAATASALATNLPLSLSPQQTVQDLPWPNRDFTVGANYEIPALGIIEASCGIAETGTVCIDSAQAPSALLFLCEELLVILPPNRIYRAMDDVWAALNPGDRRVLHLISGPSRTADVEQTIQIGAHGPRRVYLWLVA